jgi:hypothetical protein
MNFVKLARSMGGGVVEEVWVNPTRVLFLELQDPMRYNPERSDTKVWFTLDATNADARDGFVLVEGTPQGVACLLDGGLS